LIVERLLLSAETGQNLIEYGLAIAMLAFATIAVMTTLASALNTAFSTMGAILVSALG